MVFRSSADLAALYDHLLRTSIRSSCVVLLGFHQSESESREEVLFRNPAHVGRKRARLLDLRQYSHRIRFTCRCGVFLRLLLLANTHAYNLQFLQIVEVQR